jgi:hypothetical protein
MQINIDITQLFDGFHRLRDSGMITKEQHKKILKTIRSMKSFGPGSIKRDEISYEDWCKALVKIKDHFDSVYQFSRFWSIIGNYVKLAMLINVDKNEKVA